MPEATSPENLALFGWTLNQVSAGQKLVWRREGILKVTLAEN